MRTTAFKDFPDSFGETVTNQRVIFGKPDLQLGSEFLNRLSSLEDCALNLTVWLNPGTLLGFFFFFWTHLWHMEVPRLGVESELVYTTATATPDLSHTCNLHHSS